MRREISFDQLRSAKEIIQLSLFEGTRHFKNLSDKRVGSFPGFILGRRNAVLKGETVDSIGSSLNRKQLANRRTEKSGTDFSLCFHETGAFGR